jgi:hypothetical protein
MPKHTTIKVDSVNDFQAMVDEKDFTISKLVVNTILENIKTRKKTIQVLSVKCMAENQVIDITLEKIHFVETLKTNLKYFEKREMYEDCVRINEAIVQLSKSK